MAGRTRVRKPAPTIPTSALVAAATVSSNADIKKMQAVYRTYKSWQKEAWRFYEITPELHFAASWIGNALSKCLLTPGELDPATNLAKPSENANVRTTLQNFFNGPDGQAGMLQTIGIHLTIVGESYLVGRMDTAGQHIWEVVSNEEIKVTNGAWVISYGGNAASVRLNDADTVIRIWRPSPKNRLEAHSAIKALLPTLTEIEYLTRHIFAQTSSRLASAGVWVLPTEFDFPGSSSAPQANKTEAFQVQLGNSMSTALADPSNPASLVPFIITVPAEQIKNVKEPIHFWSPFDEKAVIARKNAIERFCVGMDIPIEIITGMTSRGSSGSGSGGGAGTGVSHWTSWQIEEAAIKLHIEPLLILIANAITFGYLRDVSGLPTAMVCYDTSDLRLRPDKSKQAIELAQQGKISDVALLREAGFEESDAASDDDYHRFLLQKAALAAVSPEQGGYAMRKLLGDDSYPESADTAPGSVRETRTSTADHPAAPAPPDTANALEVACNGLVLRSLERVGNRLRGQGVRPEGVPAEEVYLHTHVNGSADALLAGSFVSVEKWTAGLGMDPEHVANLLGSYTKHLITSGHPHTLAEMRRYVSVL